jgi:hypothetical protein
MSGWQKFRQILGGRSRRFRVAIYSMTSHKPYAHLPNMRIEHMSEYVKRILTCFHPFYNVLTHLTSVRISLP